MNTSNSVPSAVANLKTSILRFLLAHGCDVSFVEMEDEIPGFKGTDCSWHIGDTNVVIWPWLSDAAADALFSLRHDGLLELEPCDPLVYFIDGEIPRLPVAKKPPKKGFSKPHWLPCVLGLTPSGKAASLRLQP